jgi:hypothetical protein
VETEVKRPDRRRRLIPFSAMIALGLLATVLWLRYQARDLFADSPQLLPAHLPAATPTDGGTVTSLSVEQR